MIFLILIISKWNHTLFMIQNKILSNIKSIYYEVSPNRWTIWSEK